MLSPTEKVRLRRLERDKLIEKARAGSLLAFTLLTKPDYQVNWHHQLTCRYLSQFARRELKRIMVFEPPRHGKSELTSRRLPALLHGLYPNDEILTCSYNAELASDMTIDVQRVMDSPDYAEIFPGSRITPQGGRSSYARNSSEHELIPVELRKGEFVSPQGSLRSAGVGGSLTGRGGNWIIVDDPIKNREDADSKAFREMLWKFYTSTLRTRLEGDGGILITLTRWHDDDLASRLLALAKSDPESDQWFVLTLPAIRTSLENDYDPRQIGEPLWPDKFPLKELNAIKSNSARDWSALYQQNPVPDGGTIFGEHMFRYVELPGLFDWRFITADTAYKEKEENDFTVFSAWGVIGTQLYLIDVWAKQVRSVDIEKQVEPFIRKFVNYGYRGTFIEPKGHGIYLNQVWKNSGLMIPSDDTLTKFYADRRYDKVERANNVAPHLAHGFVCINERIVNKQELVAQCLGFPKTRHDDFVDTLVDALKMLHIRSTSILDVL